MWKGINKAWHKWSEKGMRWPFVHDPVKGKPSVTLLFFYIAFTLATLTVSTSSILLLITGEHLKATMMPIFMMFCGFIFYRLRRLDSVKINLQQRSISLSNSSNKPTKTRESNPINIGKKTSSKSRNKSSKRDK